MIEVVIYNVLLVNDFINYIDKDREGVEEKLKQVNKELSSTVKRLYVTGTADPFYSKSFREFLETLDSKKFSKLESIHLHTNGSLWNEKMWNRLSAIHPFVTSCEISIDAATKDTYENDVRIGGKWEVLLKNLEEAYKYYKTFKDIVDNNSGFNAKTIP